MYRLASVEPLQGGNYSNLSLSTAEAAFGRLSSVWHFLKVVCVLLIIFLYTASGRTGPAATW